MGWNAWPSYWTVTSPAKPITNDMTGFAIRLLYLRELVTVSEDDFRSLVTAMPTKADRNAPSGKKDIRAPRA